MRIEAYHEKVAAQLIDSIRAPDRSRLIRLMMAGWPPAETGPGARSRKANERTRGDEMISDRKRLMEDYHAHRMAAASFGRSTVSAITEGVDAGYWATLAARHAARALELGTELEKRQTPAESYRVTYNLHKYADLSDSPRHGQRVIIEESADAAHDSMIERRELENAVTADGRSLAARRRRYIGNIHNLIERA